MFIARDSFLYGLSYELEESLWAINISCLKALFPKAFSSRLPKLTSCTFPSFETRLESCLKP
jgi:hypothetical protein